MSTEREKMAAGEWYSCMDAELDVLRGRARRAVHQHNTASPDERGAMAPLLRALFASVAEGAFVEASFHCAYGLNVTLGTNVYLNAGCVILDS
ncbi:maltose acetyltransferase domain-containing protein, partial [Rhizobium sp. BR5]